MEQEHAGETVDYEIRPVGYVESDFTEPVSPEVLRSKLSRIHILPEYEEGLYGIEEGTQLNVLFLFHKNKTSDYALKGPRRHGQVLGVFACRSPRRPNRIGLSRVELVGREGPVLLVRGLDAIDGTPIVDIKPYYRGADEITADTIGAPSAPSSKATHNHAT
jgi:formylmethanofuran dehydrogenase subunit E